MESVCIDGVLFPLTDVHTAYDILCLYHKSRKYNKEDFLYKMMHIALSYDEEGVILPSTSVEQLNPSFTICTRSIKKKEKIDYFTSLSEISEDRLKKLATRKLSYLRSKRRQTLLQYWTHHYIEDEMLLLSGKCILDMDTMEEPIFPPNTPWKIIYKHRINKRSTTDEEKIQFRAIKSFLEMEYILPVKNNDKFLSYLAQYSPFMFLGSSIIYRSKFQKNVCNVIVNGTPEQLSYLKTYFNTSYASIFTGIDLWKMIRMSRNLRTCNALVSSLTGVRPEKATLVYKYIKSHNNDNYKCSEYANEIIKLAIISGDHEKIMWNKDNVTIEHLHLCFLHLDKRVLKSIILCLKCDEYPYYRNRKYIRLLCRYDLITPSLLSKYISECDVKDIMKLIYHEKKYHKEILHCVDDEILSFALSQVKDINLYVDRIAKSSSILAKYIKQLTPSLILGCSGDRWVENLAILADNGYNKGMDYIKTLPHPVEDIISHPHTSVINIIKNDVILFFNFCCGVDELDSDWLSDVDVLFYNDVIRERIMGERSLPVIDHSRINYKYLVESVCLSFPSDLAVQSLLSVISDDRVEDVAVYLYRTECESFRVVKKDTRLCMDTFRLRIRDCQNNICPWLGQQ